MEIWLCPIIQWKEIKHYGTLQFICIEYKNQPGAYQDIQYVV